MRRSRAEEIRFFRDLELRLGPSWPPKECMFAGNCERRYPDLITINDDEDDNEEDEVLMYSMCPPSALELFPIRAAWVPAVTEEDLELRLGSREKITRRQGWSLVERLFREWSSRTVKNERSAWALQWINEKHSHDDPFIGSYKTNVAAVAEAASPTATPFFFLREPASKSASKPV
ncbi:hypothetical protein Scep_018347 [Stephania cephalantha]|uniref:Uncharacterized protein n=1 Tax=Stephania cephalantha TaxID=152367 RepID=A0AAP0IR90_9MAGN